MTLGFDANWLNYDASTATPEELVLWRSGTSSRSLPDTSRRAFSLSLTTTVFSQRSTGWFSARPRRPALEGQPPSLAQHRF